MRPGPKEDADLFATLLLPDLWTAAQEPGKRKGVKPFYVYYGRVPAVRDADHRREPG